jgi:glycosyltransferase involved in cell wall biosynthesis
METMLSGFWDFVYQPPFGALVNTLTGGKPVISWFIPPASRHGGGHINLFRFAKGLQAHGFSSRIVVTHDGVSVEKLPIERIREDISEWFGPFEGGIYYIDDPALPACHVAMATGWQTAYGVRAFRGAPLKYYFVQDFEPWFYARGSEAIFAENTYRFGLTGITSGDWLTRLLREDYGMTTNRIGFSFDRNLYVPQPRRADKRRRLFFYVRQETARRGWELGYLTLKRVHELMPDVEIVAAGGHIAPGTFDFPIFSPGSVRVQELPDLYSQCDCALVLSLTNLSLLPLELLACGVPVVSNSGPNVEWLLKPDFATLCPPDPESLANGVIKILSATPENASATRRRGIDFASATDWEVEIRRMVSILRPDVARLRQIPDARQQPLSGEAQPSRNSRNLRLEIV